MFNRVKEKVCYDETQARKVFQHIVFAVNACHENNIAHRDLKPENILLVSKESDTDVKLANFDFAKRFTSPNSLTTQCGTPSYVAPEILSGLPYDSQADMWSLGVILYILLGGYQPFLEKNQIKLFKRIKKGDYKFHEEWWESVSSDAKSLIEGLITVDPRERLCAKDVLKNKWMRNAEKNRRKSACF